LNVTFEQLVDRIAPHGQQHLLRFWEELDEPARARLAEQINSLDFSFLAQYAAQQSGATAESPDARAARAKSPPAIRLAASDNRFSPAQARERGEAALRAGEVGMILVAGGQGTRLGFEHPKGLYPIGPISNRTLFEVIIDRLKATSARYGRKIPLLVMTSPATTAETEAFFLEKRHFGLINDQELGIFEQGMRPAIDVQTQQILLAERGEIALAPDGHGGMLAALGRVVGFDALHERGLKTLFYGQIDNPLLTVCDPETIGYHLLAASELTTQAVRKTDPAERVGVVAEVDGHLEIIEYSDLSPEQAARREPDGTLTFWAGNTAVHVFDVAFLQRVSHQASALPLHVANKKVPHVDAQGSRIEPAEPNAIKFEQFIFDLLPLARNALVVEVDRATAFAPVKNAEGATTDTASSAQAAMITLHASWLKACSVKVAPGVKVEIHPSYALDADELARRIAPGTQITQDTYLS
jgi:UDP-N-acetylglucosamine/UDP-N-acetylgalactosamine diphosphorylase